MLQLMVLFIYRLLFSIAPSKYMDFDNSGRKNCSGEKRPILA
ncbi:hypothetical protein GcC1_c13244o35 [Golovinomyces cichoracearum]|uniref:Uncharacterized protein n=1 Tax=Golovinomyces cichoracearum TaxID=62708 RepID=A0A420J3I2_9PEZI|nr:hypothetical protein GcC1_c13244o35 [Golovinomyces cichoracearum]